MNVSRLAPLRRLNPKTLMADNASVLVVTMIARNFLRFFSNAALTRLLAPEAFGLMLVVSTVHFIIAVLSETGINAFLIRTPHATTPRYLNVLWTIAALRGAAITTVIFVFAPQLAMLMGTPEAIWALRIACLSFFLQGIKSLSPIVTRREGVERKNALIDLGIAGLQFPITLAFAFILESYWALVIGMLVSSLMNTAASYLLYPSLSIKPALDKSIFKELWAFSRFIVGSSMITVVVVQFDKVFVTNALPLATVGLYAMAWTVASVADKFTMTFFRTVYMPDVAAAQRRGEREPDAYYHSMRFIRPLAIFACAGGVTFGHAFFDIVFDERYAQAGTFFAVLAIKPLISAYSHSSENYLVSCGNTRSKFVSDIQRLGWLPLAAFFGFQQFGIFGILGAVALIDLFPALYQHGLLARRGVLRPTRELPALMAIPAGAAAGAAMSAAWYAVS